MPTFEHGSLPLLWQGMLYSLMCQQDGDIDPPLTVEDWTGVTKVVTVAAGIVTIEWSNGYIWTCPAPENDWPGLLSVLTEAAWRTGFTCLGDYLAFSIHGPSWDAVLDARNDLNQLCWPSLRQKKALSPELSRSYAEAVGGVVSGARFVTWYPYWTLFSTGDFTAGPSGGSWVGNLEIAVDVLPLFLVIYFGLSVPWSIVNPEEARSYVDALKFGGTAATGFEDIDAIHTAAERIAFAQGTGSITDSKGQALASIAGEATTLPPRTWSLDSALRRLAKALNNWLHVGLKLTSQSGAQFIASDGLLIPGKGKR